MWECLRKFNDKYRFGLKRDLSGSGFISPKEGNNQDAVDLSHIARKPVFGISDQTVL